MASHSPLVVAAAFVFVCFFVCFFLSFFLFISLIYLLYKYPPYDGSIGHWIRSLSNGINTVFKASWCSCAKCSGAHQKAHPCSPTALYPGWSAASNSVNQHSLATTPYYWHETFDYQWNRRFWAREVALNLQRMGFLSGFSQNPWSLIIFLCCTWTFRGCFAVHEI